MSETVKIVGISPRSNAPLFQTDIGFTVASLKLPMPQRIINVATSNSSSDAFIGSPGFSLLQLGATLTTAAVPAVSAYAALRLRKTRLPINILSAVRKFSSVLRTEAVGKVAGLRWQIKGLKNLAAENYLARGIAQSLGGDIMSLLGLGGRRAALVYDSVSLRRSTGLRTAGPNLLEKVRNRLGNIFMKGEKFEPIANTTRGEAAGTLIQMPSPVHRPHNFGVPVNLDFYPFLKKVLQEADTIDPVARIYRLDRGSAKEMALMVNTNQFNFATAASHRYIGAVADKHCRSYFFRYADNTGGDAHKIENFVMHISPMDLEDRFFEAFDVIARPGRKLDMYLMGGVRYSRETLKNFHPSTTIARVDYGLKKLFERAASRNVGIVPRVVNLHDAKLTNNAVMDTMTGRFSYVDDGVIEPYHNTMYKAFNVLEDGTIRRSDGTIVTPDTLQKIFQIIIN